MSMNKQTALKESVNLTTNKQKTYQEIIEFLDAHWALPSDNKSLERMKALNKEFSHNAKKLTTILIAGTNGKSLTAHFAAKLLKKEGLTVGVFINPHILTYNERISTDTETISQKTFTDLANEVITAAQAASVTVTSREILTQMAINYFITQNVDVALFEAESITAFDAVSICSPSITALTRLINNKAFITEPCSTEIIHNYLAFIPKNSHLVSADQNKTNLKAMADYAKQVGAQWAMPIRKLVALPYPFEQLHGRCAALAERIAFLFVNFYTKKEEVVAQESLLIHKPGQRGRPTTQAKKELEINPKKTLEQFWKEISNELPGRFQILDKEKPTLLLDNANNIDAFENLLLGIKLLHYQKPLKNIAFIFGCDTTTLHTELFAKQVRYFFKKITGHVIICPLKQKAGNNPLEDAQAVQNAFKDVKIKPRMTSSFKEAFEAAKKLINDRNGLVVITGSNEILQEYWNTKNSKK